MVRTKRRKGPFVDKKLMKKIKLVFALIHVIFLRLVMTSGQAKLIMKRLRNLIR